MGEQMIDAPTPAGSLGRLAGALLCAAVLACTRTPDPPARQTGQPVRFEIVRRGLHQPTLTILGTVRPSATISLATARGGRVSYPNRFGEGLRTGEKVVAGETLATFDNESARLRLAEARLSHEQASADLERTKRSFDAGILEKEKLEA